MRAYTRKEIDADPSLFLVPPDGWKWELVGTYKGSTQAVYKCRKD